jgi:hypothetical protein
MSSTFAAAITQSGRDGQALYQGRAVFIRKFLRKEPPSPPFCIAKAVQ